MTARTETVDSVMRQQITKNMLRYAVQVRMFCPRCERVLDVSRTVEIDLSRDGKLLRTYCNCATCHDAVILGLRDTLAGSDIKIEVNDGRQLFARRAQLGPAVATAPNPVRAKDVKIGDRFKIRHHNGRMITVEVLRLKQDYWSKANRKHYVCRNEQTGREITVKSAAKFRSRV